MVRFGVGGVEFEGTVELRRRLLHPPLPIKPPKSQHAVRLRGGGIERHRALRSGYGVRKGFRARHRTKLG